MTLFLEQHQIIEGFPAVDLSDGANTGDWVSLKNYKHVTIIFRSGLGSAGQDPVLTVLQATDVSGAGSKALNIVTSPVQVFKKQAATSLASVGQWSDASGDVTTNTLTNLTSAEQSCLWILEFDGAQLDVDADFDCISCTIADVGAGAQPGDLLYILSEPRHALQPTSMPSAIVD